MAVLQKSFKACSVLSVKLVVIVVLWMNMTARSSVAATQIEVGAILDLNSTLGKMINRCLNLAINDYNALYSQTNTRINLTVEDVPQDDVAMAASRAYVLMKKKEVKAVLGPQYPEQARYIVKLGEQMNVPVIWFPITGPSLLPPPSPSSIYIGQGPICNQFQAIAATIKALGWQSIVPIYEETEYGSTLVPCLTNVLKEMNVRMANVTAIKPITFKDVANIDRILDNLKDMRTHVFLVHMSVDFGREFIKSAERKEMMVERYAWILTQELSSLTNPVVNVTRNLYRNGILSENFTDYYPLTGYMQGALGVTPKVSPNKSWLGSNLTTYGKWAYHTIEALAMALKKQDTNNINGQTLGSRIRDTNFTGESGINFDLKSGSGQLVQSEFEVYNVIAKRERHLGTWSLKNNGLEGGGEQTSEYQLRDPMWPGDTLDKPPKLRIGVTRTNFFPEFVSVESSVQNKSELQYGGFVISVFLKAVHALPFPLNNYEFVPLPKEKESPMMDYDDILCNKTKDEDLDAIIGDITIVAHRLKCVDFTLPYLDSSVAMVVRVKNVSTSTEILFKPFEWTLWLILGVIFVAATIIIIILEKYKSTTNKVDEFLVNPFLVYKMDVMEKFASSAAGWMVILTSFLFILMLQVYTANLTSILTQAEIKEPAFKNETEIIGKNNMSVGYQNGSWVKEFLINQVGFDQSQLRSLGSREEYNSALSTGTVQAIFDETPYLTLFLSKYKSSFMLAGPIYKTGGFAFAFPPKSSLCSHFSNATLKVTQDAEPYRVMMAMSSLPTSIEDLEFKAESDVETSRLSIDKIRGLYPVPLSVVALFVCLSIPLGIQRLPKSSSVIEWLRNKKQLFAR